MKNENGEIRTLGAQKYVVQHITLREVSAHWKETLSAAKETQFFKVSIDIDI